MLLNLSKVANHNKVEKPPSTTSTTMSSAADMPSSGMAANNPPPVLRDSTNKPVVVGLYGLPGCGKTTLMGELKQKLGEDLFMFFEGYVVENVFPYEHGIMDQSCVGPLPISL